MTESERFESYVNRTGCCHLWTGPTTDDGYPRFWSGGRWVRAHRYAWLRAGLELGTDDTLDHLIGLWLPCSSTLCVRLDHLQAVSNGDNLRLRHERERQLIGAQAA
jgi:hypothetical protein